MQEIGPNRKTFREKVKEAFDVGAESGVDTLSEIFLDGVIGAVVPGASSLIFSYKQNKSEKNMLRFIHELMSRMDKIEENLSKLSEENLKKIKEYFAGLLCEYVIDEQEEEKIRYIANGFVSLTGQENLETQQTILYLDILKNLRLIDLKILFDMNKVILHDGNYVEYLDSLGIDSDYYRLSKDKLLRQGLLKSSYDNEYQKIVKKVNEITDWAMSIQKGKPNKLPTNFASFKPKDRENLTLSQLGRSFISYFSVIEEVE